MFYESKYTASIKKTLWESFEKRKRNTEYSTMHIFFYCYQRVVFSDIKSKTFIYVRKFKKVPTCLLFLKILNSNSTCPPPLPLIQNRELFQGLNYKIKSIYRLIKIQSCLTYFLQSHSSTWFSPALIIVPLNAIHFFGITEYVWAKHK